MPEVRDAAIPKTETTVVCRPYSGIKTGSILSVAFGLGAIGLLFGVLIFLGLFLTSGQIAPCLGLAFLTGGPLLFISAWAFVYQNKACVIADAEGLRWRGAGRWKQAAWKDVVSYSDDWTDNPKTLNAPRIKVKTLNGTLLVSPAQWTGTGELREIIQKNAAASQSGWIVTGSATHCLPLSCRYDTTVNRNILGWMETVHKYGLLAVAVYFAVQWFMTHTLPGWGWLLTPTGLFVIAKQTLPFLLRPMYRATQPRLGDKVFADRDGLRFVSGGIETAMRWAQITDLYAVGIRNVVVTPAGEHDFLDTLSDSDRLKLVIPRMASNAGYRGWRTGTVRRQERASPDGRHSVQCIYRYRSQNNCGSLWGVTLALLFIAGMLCGPALITYQGGSMPGLRETELAGGGLAVLLLLFWLWGNYWLGEIRTDTEGITQQTVFGKRFLAWNQVREFHWRGDADLSWGRVQGMSGTLWFWKGIGDADRLADEIAAKTEF